MRVLFVPLVLVLSVLVSNTRTQDFTKLQFRDCGSRSAVIHNVDLTPMPLYNPGNAFLTFHATLNRPVRGVNVTLDIMRTVSGIALPVRCYLAMGQWVGSCTYELCTFLQTILDDFNPTSCPSILAQYGIDCTCPFNIAPQVLNINNHQINVPDASQTAATFLASGNFNITINVKEHDTSAPTPYGCGVVLLTIKKAPTKH